MKDIRKILIVGAGTMGQQIGFICAVHGCEVIIYDALPDALGAAESRVKSLSEKMVKKGRVTARKAEDALSRIRYTADPVEGKDADLINESVPEDPALKGKVFGLFHEICKPETIFTTNTSSLVPSLFAEATKRPKRFLAFHFYDVSETDVVDIMPHPGTDPACTEMVRKFAERIGQIPIVLNKEQSGFVFNAMLMPLIESAVKLAVKDVASYQDIDRAWMGIMHTKSGPFGIMDSIGLDTVWKVTAYWAAVKKDPKAVKNADFIKEYVDRGDLGKKSGKGFYTYPDPEFARPGFLKETPVEK